MWKKWDLSKTSPARDIEEVASVAERTWGGITRLREYISKPIK
jgi:hypothetical protein